MRLPRHCFHGGASAHSTNDVKALTPKAALRGLDIGECAKPFQHEINAAVSMLHRDQKYNGELYLWMNREHVCTNPVGFAKLSFICGQGA